VVWPKRLIASPYCRLRPLPEGPEGPHSVSLQALCQRDRRRRNGDSHCEKSTTPRGPSTKIGPPDVSTGLTERLHTA
jgi:hypothetical protein